ncbi:hypothetical protein K456DRAFT_1911839 [Colletotrichum gloeosporioides 23]|nr:hypothetical protein K456DRAFT_1911839 [Colletotrichum gloeosporioides 23]
MAECRKTPLSVTLIRSSRLAPAAAASRLSDYQQRTSALCLTQQGGESQPTHDASIRGYLAVLVQRSISRRGTPSRVPPSMPPPPGESFGLQMVSPGLAADFLQAVPAQVASQMGKCSLPESPCCTTMRLPSTKSDELTYVYYYVYVEVVCIGHPIWYAVPVIGLWLPSLPSHQSTQKSHSQSPAREIILPNRPYADGHLTTLAQIRI